VKANKARYLDLTSGKRRIQEARAIMINDWYLEPFSLLYFVCEPISDRALLVCWISARIATGVTPCSRFAMPSVLGLDLVNTSFSSVDKACKLFG
jgi:hypothetical protein